MQDADAVDMPQLANGKLVLDLMVILVLIVSIDNTHNL
jgi:hypothetical protein